MSSRVTHYFSGNPCSFEEIKMYDILKHFKARGKKEIRHDRGNDISSNSSYKAD